MNIQLAQRILEELIKQSVQSFCLCPGARCAPFVELLSQNKSLNCMSFFEERSAAFFALGRVQRDQKPVAVVTTSGTAVAELLPAVIEAYYSALPLVLITADRPLEFGKHASPQTLKSAIEILEKYCHKSKNIQKEQDVDFSEWNPLLGSLHLNVCFDEPLIDQKPSQVSFVTKTHNSYNKKYLQSMELLKQDATFQKQLRVQLNGFFQKSKKPLVLIGSLNLQERIEVKKQLSHYKGLVYLEPLSNLQGYGQSLLSGDRILQYALKKDQIDGVIRLGGIPRVRFWRDLEKSCLPVAHFSSAPFYSGLTRSLINTPLLPSLNLLTNFLFTLGEFAKDLKAWDQEQCQKLQSLIKEFPQSEESWFLTLKKSLKNNTKVFLGNSSPIRLWDKLSFCSRPDLLIRGQSGVNGIDGLLSRFFGECTKDENQVGILGDLSLLYDLSAFWRSQTLPPWTVVVINNFGGQIFSRKFKNPAFLNTHRLSFSSLAKMWDVNYFPYKDSQSFALPDSDYNLLEIQPVPEQTRSFLIKEKALWQIEKNF